DCCSNQAPAVTLAGNAKLPDLDGLESFVRFDSLRLHDNPALATLDGLDNLVEVHTLDITFDPCLANNQASLVNLVGAPNLAQIGVLQIQWVDSLTSFVGLESLSTLDTLKVRNNEALPWDAVLELVAQTQP